jgi:polysaccharide export outer membrane protein
MMNINEKTYWTLALVLIWSLSSIGQTATPDLSGYRIRYNDVLEVSIFGNPDLNKQAVVPPDGIISFALIGEVSVIDMTPRELESKLTNLYTKFLVNPVVSVSMHIFEAKQVFIIGEVRIPGPKPYDSTRTFADYMVLAGGFTPEANLKRCMIIRANAPTVKEKLNLKDFNKHGTLPQITLYPEDTVYIPRRSPYVIYGWGEWSQFIGIILGATTLYLILSKQI